MGSRPVNEPERHRVRGYPPNTSSYHRLGLGFEQSSRRVLLRKLGIGLGLGLDRINVRILEGKYPGTLGIGGGMVAGGEFRRRRRPFSGRHWVVLRKNLGNLSWPSRE